jgi:predicted Abi (CAAX) family protease
VLKKRLAKFGGDQKLLDKASDDEVMDTQNTSGLVNEANDEDQEKLKLRMAKFGTGQAEAAAEVEPAQVEAS